MISVSQPQSPIERRPLSISQTPFFQLPIMNLFKVLTTFFYTPKYLLSCDDTEISACPISDKDLNSMINAFTIEQQRVLFALRCQFNSVPPPRDYNSLVKFVFGYASQEEKDKCTNGIAQSLWYLLKPEYSVATLLINHTDVGIKKMYDVEEENKARRAEVDRLVAQIDDIMVRNPSDYLPRVTNVSSSPHVSNQFKFKPTMTKRVGQSFTPA